MLKNDSVTVAKWLLGKTLYCNGKEAVITETEAYGDEDPTCYGVRYGKNKNTAISFQIGGHLFVYAGMLMITTGKEEDKPQNVLLRAASRSDCRGPCRLKKYFGIDKNVNGTKIGFTPEDDVRITGDRDAPYTVALRGRFCEEKIARDYEKRYSVDHQKAIAITHEYVCKKWRFACKNNKE